MRRSWLAVAVVTMGCTPGVATPRPERDPQVFTETPTCAFTILGTFSHSNNVLREVQVRGGDAAIEVREETGNLGSTDPKSYSGSVVRFTDPACKPPRTSRAPVNGS
jgi:hypothetical protein